MDHGLTRNQEGLYEVGGARLRALVEALVADAERLPQPARDLPDVLAMRFLDGDVEFNDVRVRIADVHADMFQASTGYGKSSSRSRDLDHLLARLSNERDAVMERRLASPDFDAFLVSSHIAFDNRMEEWKALQSCSERLKSFLGRSTLPSIAVRSIDPFAVQMALVDAFEMTPQEGDAVMMGEEPIGHDAGFGTRYILNSGVHPMFAGKSVRIPYRISSTMGAEAEFRGATRRMGHLVVRLDADRRPADVDWSTINPYLPYVARSMMMPILPVIMPSSARLCEPMLLLEKDAAEVWRRHFLVEHDAICMICGSGRSVEPVSDWAFVEPVLGTRMPGIARLISVTTMCGDCRAALRPSPQSLDENGLPPPDVIMRLSRINRWTGAGEERLAPGAYVAARSSWARRSRLSWMTDWREVSQHVDCALRLSFTADVDSAGWIGDRRWLDGSKVKLVGERYRDAAGVFHFFPAPPRIFEVEWGSHIDEVEFDGLVPVTSDSAASPAIVADASPVFSVDGAASSLSPFDGTAGAIDDEGVVEDDSEVIDDGDVDGDAEATDASGGPSLGPIPDSLDWLEIEQEDITDPSDDESYGVEDAEVDQHLQLHSPGLPGSSPAADVGASPSSLSRPAPRSSLPDFEDAFPDLARVPPRPVAESQFGDEGVDLEEIEDGEVFRPVSYD